MLLKLFSTFLAGVLALEASGAFASEAVSVKRKRSVKQEHRNRKRRDFYKGIEINTKKKYFYLLTSVAGNESFIKDFFDESGLAGSEFFRSARDARSNPAYKNIIYYRGHFHWSDPESGSVFDSYKKPYKWQRNQSNGLCQTFALIGIAGKGKKYGLINDGFVRENSYRAMDFWTHHSKLMMAYWDGVLEILEEDEDIVVDFTELKKPESTAQFRHLVESLKKDINILLDDEQIEI